MAITFPRLLDAIVGYAIADARTESSQPGQGRTAALSLNPWAGFRIKPKWGREHGVRKLASGKGGQSMPLFEYQCQGCGQIFEVFTKRRDLPSVPKCPSCGKTNLERVLSAFSGTTHSGNCGTSSAGFG